MAVDFDTNSRLHIKLTDQSADRWEIPESIIPRPTITSAASDPLYSFEYTSDPFTFKVIRKSDQRVVFDSSAVSLVYKDQFLQIGSKLDSRETVYGIGKSILFE